MMATKRSPMAEAIKRGMALLDEKVPGWEDRIDMATLDIGSVQRCVACQVIGRRYSASVHELGLHSMKGYLSHGFSIPHGVDSAYMTRCWKQAIGRRLAAKKRGEKA